MIPHRATLDVSRELAQYLGRLLWQERRLRATPKGSRALTCFRQAVMVLRWFRGERDIPKLGRDHKVSRATAYRYIDEGIAVLAAQAPDLHGALERARNDGNAYLITDGTLLPTDRCAEQTISVKANRSICGTPARPISTPATSKPSRPPPGSRCGPPMSNPARSTT